MKIDIEERVDMYVDLLEKVDYHPFIMSNIFIGDLVYFQNKDYIQNKFNIIENTHLLKLLYLNLKRTTQKINTADYFVDPSEIYHKYNLKALIKYNWKYKFSTYYNQWIRKIKLEYAKKIKEYNKEINMDFNIY